jgi:hypothetical protein
MEEKRIKDFDRTIEHMMNESAVSPPFGMWNRIASELDAPVAGMAPSKPLMPKGVVAGLIAGAIVIGSSVAGLVMFNHNQDKMVAGAEKQQVVTITHTQAQQQQAKEDISIVADNGMVNTPEVKTTAKRTIKAKKAASFVTMGAGGETASVQNNDKDVAAPDMAISENGMKAEDSYYFPPVDINVAEEKPAVSTSGIVTPKPTDVDKDKDDSQEDSKKLKTSSSSSNQHIKFKKKRRSRYTYPTIIRGRRR